MAGIKNTVDKTRNSMGHLEAEATKMNNWNQKWTILKSSGTLLEDFKKDENSWNYKSKGSERWGVSKEVSICVWGISERKGIRGEKNTWKKAIKNFPELKGDVVDFAVTIPKLFHLPTPMTFAVPSTLILGLA